MTLTEVMEDIFDSDAEYDEEDEWNIDDAKALEILNKREEFDKNGTKPKYGSSMNLNPFKLTDEENDKVMFMREIADKNSYSFQSFLHVDDNPNIPPWNQVKETLRNCIKNKCNLFILLAECLSYYDYHDAPSNWKPKYKHQQTIKEWTIWLMVNMDLHKEYDIFENEEELKLEYKEHEKDIEIISSYRSSARWMIKSYARGMIPDAFTFMIDYFT